MDRIETLRELKEQAIQLETDKKEEEKFLSKANPELVNAVRNIQFLEAQLAQKDLENKRLTALVSVLEMKVRDAVKN
jgi:dynactin complex subunit